MLHGARAAKLPRSRQRQGEPVACKFVEEWGRLLLQGGWLCSQLECDVTSGGNTMTPRRNSAAWFAVGSNSAVALQAHMLVGAAPATPTRVSEHARRKPWLPQSLEVHCSSSGNMTFWF